MRIAVFGSGAVGGYFGGRLAQAGEDVIFIARGKHLDAMLTDGLKVHMAGAAGFERDDVGLDFGQASVVRAVMYRVAEKDPNVVVVDTTGFPMKTDNIHLSSEGALKLGEALAEEYLRAR